MGRCAKATKNFAKDVWRQLKAEGVAVGRAVFAALADLDISNEEKREIFVQVVRSVTNAKEYAVRTLLERLTAELDKFENGVEAGSTEADDDDLRELG